MTVRMLLVCLLMSTFTACGAANHSAAQGPSQEPGEARSENSDATPPDAQPQPGTGADSPMAGEVAGDLLREKQVADSDAADESNTRMVAFTPQEAKSAAGEPAPKPANDEPANDEPANDEPANDEPANDEDSPTEQSEDIVLLARSIRELRGMIEEVRNQNSQIMAALRVDPTQSGVQLSDPSAPPPPRGSLADIVLDLRQTVAHLAEENQAFGQLLQEQTTALKPVSPTPTQGTLVVENNTDSDQYVWIDGVGRWVWARTQINVTVPVGEVTTKLSGEEEKTWQIAAPDYREHIEFVRP